MRFAAGTRQFSKVIWQVEDAQRPSFFSSGPRERPGRAPSSFAMTAKQEISLCFSFSAVSEGIRAKTEKKRAKAPFEIHCFVPFKTYSFVAGASKAGILDPKT